MSTQLGADNKYIKRVRNIAMLWTLLIFILCFIPGENIPEIKVPLIDKVTHFILFGVFVFLWHATVPKGNIIYKTLLLLIAFFMGWLIEYVQGHYVPHRSQDNMDTLADAIGSILGIITYSISYYKYKNNNS